MTTCRSKSARQCQSLAAATFILCFTSACGFKFYDAGQDKIATDAKEAFEKVELAKVIELERGNQEHVIEHEIALARRSTEVIGDLRLLRVVSSEAPVARSVWAAMDERLAELGADGFQNGVPRWSDVGRLGPVVDGHTQILRSRARLLQQILGAPPPACLPLDQQLPEVETLLKGLDEQNIQKFRDSYLDYRSICDRAREEITKREASLGTKGTIKRALEDWRKAVEDLEKVQKEARLKVIAFKKAEKDWKAATGSDDAESISKGVESAIAAFENALSALKDAQDITSRRFLSEQQVSALDRLVTAATSGEDPGSESDSQALKRASLVAASLKGLATDFEALLKAGESAPHGQLSLLRQRAKLERDYAKTRADRQQQRVELARLKFLALADEARVLSDARYSLCRFMQYAIANSKEVACETIEISFSDSRPSTVTCRFVWGEGQAQQSNVLVGNSCPLAWSLSAASANSVPGEAKAELTKSVADFVNAAKVAQSKNNELVYRGFAVEEQAALDADEHALDLWNTLIATPINSLAAYHATGVKPEELANTIVSAAGFAGLAIQVD